MSVMGAGSELTAFAAGLVSFLSPCVLPLVPAYVSYVAGTTAPAEERRMAVDARIAAVTMSLFFVLGFGAVFVALGAGATALGALLLHYRYEANLGAGVALLAAYALGLGVPFVLSALFTRELAHRLKALRRIGVPLQRVAGAIMVGVGAAMLLGELNTLSIRMLQLFPALGTLG